MKHTNSVSCVDGDVGTAIAGCHDFLLLNLTIMSVVAILPGSLADLFCKRLVGIVS